MERELTEPVSLCGADGRLDPRAVGWSRRPLHRCNLRGRWPRTKRWDYWAFTTDRHLLYVLVADVDYLGLAAVSILDLANGRRFEAAAVTPFGLGARLPETVLGSPIRFDHLGVRIAIEPRGPSGVAIAASGRALRGGRLDVDLVVERPPGHDSLNVVVPFKGERFQFTSKHVGLPASGSVSWEGERIDVERASAFLDFGRGIWPRSTSWCWAAAAGTAGGRAIAWNLGGRWTDGTGATENGVWIDGRLHKIGEPVSFVREQVVRAGDRPAPGWRIRTTGSARLDLSFAAVQRRRVDVELGLGSAHLDWAAGRFSGEVTSDAGERIAVDGILGWAEELDARW